MYQIRRTQIIPADLQTCWGFFADSQNLLRITPPNMQMKPLTKEPEHMYPGLMIAYKVTPLLGIKLTWITEITHVYEKQYFIDEQRKGPFRIWHHEHHFKAVEGGTEMTDLLSYELPLGLLGKLANPIIVRKNLNDLFDYRYQRIEEIFKR